ncbi:sugar porter family MFS transporter [Chitinophaga pollutisoli]|uniref:Sugar porter family MFS transporter n=1 Tax=Chitinophaga pollutisoli TaxID=3133966 RepID=A0ABZ2YT88_9BACT
MSDKGLNKLYIYKIALVASIGGFLFGYDLVIISGALPFLEADFGLSPAMKGFAVSSAILGAISGPLVGLWCADRLGRRKTMMLASFFFMISAIGSGLALGIWDFALWRFLGGVGIGLAMMSSPIYIAELAPPHLRGVLVNVNQLSNVIGINLAVIAGYLFSFDGWGWRWMMFSEGLPVVFLVMGLLVIPESPRWLVAQRRGGEALKILERINGRRRAEEELAEINAGLQQEAGGSFREAWQPGIRTALIIGTILMIFSQVNGVNMMLLYAPTIMAEAGVSMGSSAILSSIPVYFVILVCTLLAFPLIRKFSRRGLLIASVSLMALGHLVMALNLYQGWPPMFTLIPMFIGTGAFTLGFAPLSWIIASEIFPTRIRSKALAVVCFFLYLSSFVIAQFFPMLTDFFTRSFGDAAGVYVLFAAVCLSCVWFSWKKVPETKGLSLEEIGRFWQGKGATESSRKNGVPESVS